MHRLVFALTSCTLVLAALLGSALPASGARATSRCGATAVAVTINGALTCRPFRSVAPIRSTGSDATFIARRMLGTDGIEFPLPKLRNGAAIRSAYTPAQARRIEAALRAVETEGLAAAVGALAPKSGLARLHERRAARALRAAPAGVVVSQPVTTINSTSASISITATVTNGTGDTTTITAGLDARINPDGTATADMNFGTSRSDASGITRGSEARGNILGKDADYCPSSTGVIRYTEPTSFSSTDTISQQLGPINSGTVTTVRSSKGTATGTGRLNPDATLAPIPFRISTTSTLSMRGNGLIGAIGGVLGSFYAMSATATASGTINPKTGAIDSSSRFDVRTTGTGSPEMRAAAARQALDEARSLVGRQFDHFKKVERWARAGDCTYIQFEPGSGAQLGAGQTTTVRATLRMRSDAQAVVPKPVSWTMTASRGKVAPAKGSENEMRTTVTGVGPFANKTAIVAYRAVSRAGISRETWVGLDSPFPKTYSGTISYRSLIGSIVDASSAMVTYQLTSSTNNPDGSKSAWYEAVASDVTSSELTINDQCTFTYGPTDPGDPQDRKAGDLEINVSPDGAWTAGALLDVALGTKTGTGSCPPPTVPPPYNPNPKFFLNTRSYGGALQAIPPRGAFTATDVAGTAFAGTSTASWSLLPGA
jgi:hypothetical protein